MITGKYLVRPLLSIQQHLEDGELENVYWITGTEIPADGLTKLCSEMGPFWLPWEQAGLGLVFCVPSWGWHPGNDAPFSLSLAV